MRGACRAGGEAVVASYGPHWGEEAPLVGNGGSGTIFFSYCNLDCVFCQNFDISVEAEGETMTPARLAEVMIGLQERGCENINLVSPTHYVPTILDALVLAVEKGLTLPIVYNTGGYDSMEVLQLLDGVVDIYLPDFKFADDDLGRRYCGVPDYGTTARQAIRAMHKQVGNPVLDDRGVAQSGLLIRHLVLPGLPENSLDVIRFIVEEVAPDAWVNLMDQYRPEHRASDFPPLNRRLSGREFWEVWEKAQEIGPQLHWLQ
ncbi:radical SAM protein [Heliobacterium undosum]|uniref:Radical SAM protein n=2 Tax=Heliomicrobium undosum TaxID=121734 RepID=A0A845L593_9FIRM|nr:radical SAM protein [Heliomicrobium undosum]